MEATATLETGRQLPKALQVLTALRHRNYRIYWIGFLISIIGWQIQTVSLGWFVFDRTGSALYLGIVSGSQAVASIIFSIAGGVIADRVERRKMLMVTQSGAFCCAMVLAVLVLTDVVQLWQIAIIAFVFGSLQAFDQPTRAALVPQLIDRSELNKAVALQMVVWQSSTIVGPAIAGLIVGIFGISVCFLLTSAGFAAFVIALSMIKVQKRSEPVERKSMASDFGAGISYIRKNSMIRSLIGLAYCNALFGFSFIVLMPVFARETLHLGAGGLGLMFSAMGIGALCGTVVAATLSDIQRKGLLIIGGACLFGGLLILFGLSVWFELSLALLVLIGGVRSVYMTTSTTLLQLRMQDRYRGRVSSVHGLMYSLMPLGGLQAGVIADVWGAPVAVAFGGVLVIFFALLIGLRQPELRGRVLPNESPEAAPVH